MTPHRTCAGALAGAALAATLAACSGGSAGTASGTGGYTPYTGSGSAAVPAAGTGSSLPTPAPATAQPQAPPTNFTALARRFVALRNQGDQELAAIRGQASSTDLAADKSVMAQAAAIFGNYATELRQMPFPGQMRGDADTLAKVVSSISSAFTQASQVTDWNQLDPLLQTLVDAEDTELAATNALEKDLYLPQSTPQPQQG